MPDEIRTVFDYRNAIQSRSEADRSAAAQRHMELLSHTEQSIHKNYGSRMSSLTKIGTNSQSYDDIIRTLNTIEDSLDVILNDDQSQFAFSALMDAYAMLMRQCDIYLSTHSGRRYSIVGKRRVRLIQRLRERVDDEAQLLRERLVGFDSVGTGITARQFLAGMKPIKEAIVQESSFSLPRMAEVEFGP